MPTQEPRSTTSVYVGVLITIVITLISVYRIWKIQKSRDKGISRQAHSVDESRFQSARDERNPDISLPDQASTTPRPQFVDHSAGDRSHGILFPLQAPSTTSEPQSIDQDTRDDCKSDISLPVQASIAPRLQPFDHSSGDEGRFGISVPLQALPTTSESHEVARRRGATESKPSISVVPVTVDYSAREARNEDDHDIPIPIETPLISLEHPSIGRGGGDVHSIETVDGEEPDSPVPEEASVIATKLHSVDYGDGDVQRGDALSTSIIPGASNTSNQISPTPKLEVATGANIHIEHAQIGGGNAFGSNSVVNNNTFISGDGQFTENQRSLICNYIAELAVLPDINVHLKKHILTQLIISLPRAESAFDDYQTKKKCEPCFEGTRVALLREMAEWATSPDESRMYVLSGLAGIGKSTVAYTIASRAANPKLNLLGASFFFSRDEADRNNAKKIFTTIAYQLCVYDEMFAKAIGDALLERGSAATTKNPHEQLQALILDPLRSIVQSHTRPILVVVDALDECCERDVPAVVNGLSQLVRDLPSFKVILTTRPLPYPDDFLRIQGGRKLLHLQNIEDKVVDGDIRLYLRYNLSLEKSKNVIPGDNAVRYILDNAAFNPAAQMQKLLRAFTQDHTPFKDLDYFYTVILRNIVPANCDDDDIVSRYQSVVGAITSVSHPLPVSALAHLINMDVGDIHAVLEKLQSVVLLGDDDVPRIYHKLFPDYLTDQARCKDHCLRIDPKISHTQIVTCCFEITNKHLEYNILGLGNVARYMSNKEGLEKDGITDVQLQEKIPQQLRYACVYWANHFEVANIEDSNLRNGLTKFVDGHTLHWLEVLSLIGNLNLAHRAIHCQIYRCLYQ
ncbi:hypothetical protein M378DRAFT_16098 [Amanita muscaria Koide BX008]|uniref:NACHT domain-containing protein n=1 Tax=Amanita muscaria (strain Koide BX008) TaxID=946122 RepID=A0A0C2SUF0_AMAMK|nr:hypothetical protein M378DRAFT_16098 [Amanita muscaria Koide BX008]